MRSTSVRQNLLFGSVEAYELHRPKPALKMMARQSFVSSFGCSSHCAHESLALQL